MTTTRQVAEIADVCATIGVALTDLQRLRSYIEAKLEHHQDVASIAAELLNGLEETRRRLGVARIQCMLLSTTEINGVREAAEQLGLLN